MNLPIEVLLVVNDSVREIAAQAIVGKQGIGIKHALSGNTRANVGLQSRDCWGRITRISWLF